MKYNCCSNGELPDMSLFTHLEVNAIYPWELSDGSTDCEALFGVACGKANADELLAKVDKSKLFYTVFGREEDGSVEPLHDETALEKLLEVANDLSSKFNLEIIIN